MFSANLNITVSLDEQTRQLLAVMAAAFGRGETVTIGHDFAAAEPVPVQEEQKPAIATATEPEKETPAEKDPTLEDVRAAITAARVRIEGEDWQTATSEGRKLYHAKVTEKIKQLASLFDATKPSEIKAENRKQFIRELQDLGVDENGDIVQLLPF